MVALLVTLAVMSVILGVAMPVWRTVVQREKEEELIFRGRQYARAIQLYQRKYAAAYPASIDVLVEQKFLRKKYKDPMTKSGEFEILYQGTLAQRQAANMAGRGGTTPGMQPGMQPTTGAGRAGTAGQAAAAPGSAFGSQVAGTAGRRRWRREQEQREVVQNPRRAIGLQRVAVRVRPCAGHAHRAPRGQPGVGASQARRSPARSVAGAPAGPAVPFPSAGLTRALLRARAASRRSLTAPAARHETRA